MIQHWPAVTAVVPTHRRPELLRAAVRSILAQDYPGRLDVIVVHDDEPVRDDLLDEAPGRVLAIANTRTPGLSGARNTGILAARGVLVAFCDDDDTWVPAKLRKQVERLRRDPRAVMATSGSTIDFAGRETVRRTGTDTVHHDEVLASRIAAAGASTFVLRRDWLVDGQLINEELPRSMGEDWDLLLRASRSYPLAHVDEPLVRTRVGEASNYTSDWHNRLAANHWFLTEYPDIRRNRRGLGRLYGQNGYFCAASGDRIEAARWIARTVRVRPGEPRAWLAIPVVAAPPLGNRILNLLRLRGRGI